LGIREKDSLLESNSKTGASVFRDNHTFSIDDIQVFVEIDTNFHYTRSNNDSRHHCNDADDYVYAPKYPSIVKGLSC